jgi:hypothetical protein
VEVNGPVDLAGPAGKEGGLKEEGKWFGVWFSIF